MKYFLLSVLLAACLVQQSAAQVPMSAAIGADTGSFTQVAAEMRQFVNAIYGPDSASQARATKKYARWETFWDIRYCAKTPAGVSGFTPLNQAMDYVLRNPSCLGSPGFKGNWSNIGPDYNSFGCTGAECQTSGRMMCVWVNPFDKGYILAGAASGGLWKTVDSGRNWYNITDGSASVSPGTIGVTSIAVHPWEEDKIYLATNSFGIHEYGSKYGLGLVYSTNAGVTWQTDFEFRTLVGTSGNKGVGLEIPKIAYNKNLGTLYTIYNNRVYQKEYLGAPWRDITPADMISKCAQYGYKISDFEFTLNPANRMVVATEGLSPKHHLFIYDEYANSWTSKETNFLQGDSCMGMRDIAVSVNDEVLINFWDRRDDLAHSLYKTGISPGSPLRLIYSFLPTSARILEVSEANPAIVYLTNCNGSASFIQKSIDSGRNWTYIGNTHADGRGLFVDITTNTTTGINDVIYCATDGGIAMKSAGETNFHSIVGNGLVVAQFSGLSSSPSKGHIVAGAIDNGNQNYIKDRPVRWSWHIDGDGMVPAYAKNGAEKAYTQTQDGVSGGFVFNGNTASNASYWGNPPDNMKADAKWFKPLKFDDQNIARIGWHFIWKRELDGAPDWTYSFGTSTQASEPKAIGIFDTLLIKNYKKPRDFLIAANDNRKGYIAYTDNGGDITQQNTMTGKLFFSTSLTPNNQPSWINVTPPYSDKLPITDIEVHPLDAERIWVAYGSIDTTEIPKAPANRKTRVVYHPMHGDKNLANWIDISQGLPALPVTKLLYVEGSDDVLFAATDVGVYRWNKYASGGGQWECFDNGMPRCMISDMELNYCTGKLRVATFGRGIWETDYAANMSAAESGDAQIITGNTTWNSSKTISGNVRVKAGGTLTISGSTTKIYMPRKARILVEAGGRLIVDGATLTNECGYFWKGIEVTGQQTQAPTTNYQGYLELRNGARIENAKEGVWNFTWDNGAQGGGIIKSTDATFYNCWRSVALNDYPGFSYTYGGISQCRFERTDFIVDGNLLQQPGQFFSSWNTQGGIHIRNCKFRNDAPFVPGAPRGTGIHIGQTGLQVDATTFQGLTRGIYAAHESHTARTVKIYGNTFTGVQESITLGGTSFGDVKTNIIQYMPARSYGIYLDGTQGSYIGCNNKIIGNYFGGNPRNGGDYGLIANHTRGYENHVLNNQFNNLTIGMQSQLRNNKLFLRCNTHQSNAYPWLINPTNTLYSFTQQGSLSNPAGNKFISNLSGIRSYLTLTGWTYYTGTGTNEVPAIQGNISLVSTGKAAYCRVPMECYTIWGVTEKNEAIATYGTLVSAGQRYSPEGRFAYGAIMQAYTALGDLDGMEDFLESENDDESNLLLVSLYTDRQQYTLATNTLTALHLSPAATNYYSLLINLAQNNRRPDSLTTNEYLMLEDLAVDTIDVSPFAKAYLEMHYNLPWEHPIEEMPLDLISGKSLLPISPDGLQSRLLDAAPNPAAADMTLGAFVNERDAGNQAYIVVRDAAGAEMYRSAFLVKGDNRIVLDVRKWRPGVYLYTLASGGENKETKKLSIIR